MKVSKAKRARHDTTIPMSEEDKRVLRPGLRKDNEFMQYRGAIPQLLSIILYSDS
jgi:hypothetical protein